MSNVKEPTEKQLKYCYDILARVGSCKSDEYGQPLFETSMVEADKFIKAHRRAKWAVDSDTTAADWGGIPNH